MRRHFQSEQKFCQKIKTSTRSRDTTRALPRPPPAGLGGASKLRHAQETAWREMDLSSSYLEDGSKTGLSEPSTALVQPLDTSMYLYVYV